MPKIRRRGLAQGGELPGTLKRSSKEAQETFTKARDSAVRTYGEGDQADRAAYTEFKRKFEKRGDHWIPKRSADSADLAVTTKVPARFGGNSFPVFQRPHLIHRTCLVIRIKRCLSIALCTVRPQVPWITSEIAVRSTFIRPRHGRDGRRRCTAAARARICR
jgi:hypothetical protein